MAKSSIWLLATKLMHEFSIIDALFDDIHIIAQNNQLTRITNVHLEVGELRLIIPEMLHTAFEAASQGTIAAHANIELTEKKALVKCRQCEKNFAPQIDNFQCPGCLSTAVQILQGNDIVLLSIKGEQKGGPNS